MDELVNSLGLGFLICTVRIIAPSHRNTERMKWDPPPYALNEWDWSCYYYWLYVLLTLEGWLPFPALLWVICSHPCVVCVCVCVCVCACVCLVAQSCLTLCDPMEYSPPGSSVHGISQARILEWVAISFSRGSSRLRNRTSVSCVSCITGGFFTTEPPGKPP